VPEEVKLEVSYVGAPEYRIEVQAPDYKAAEAELEAAAARAKAAIEELGGTAEYHRERHEDDE
jgi:translation initiation factor 2 subunit 1